MTTHSATTGRLRTRAAVFACVAAAALILDQGTKALAQSFLSETHAVRVIPGLLSLRLVHNPGASLGMGSSATWLISLFALVACCALAWLALRTVSMRWTVLLALAFSGALGNLIDRVAYADGFLNGKVVDFLDYGWSVGNVADVFLVLAGAGIVLLIARNEPLTAKDLEARAASSDADAAEAEAAGADTDGSDTDKEEHAQR
ncbi:lipoprotein signal peptidase [Bifidobacterium sp. DSM 109958]|uniref:Lipoprotein signal peptidase n=1 Tax=Bifidobacterium moraviense TaxID=2675323 RepID=A0A7Y0F153_9BIFI|nr:signal peptidase II [Bifidobacterium sp. DSM 109958]NMN00105.1 lipoprotein signal peptidase [Bifidobacterium sp. DSM 109958]